MGQPAEDRCHTESHVRHQPAAQTLLESLVAQVSSDAQPLLPALTGPVSVSPFLLADHSDPGIIGPPEG